VDHSLLLTKLSLIGFCVIEIAWLKDYLYNRQQTVVYNGTSSGNNNVTVGVPQGSILGPLLFVLFINDLPTVLSKSKVVLYADDTALFSSGNATSVRDDLQSDLDALEAWFSANKLTLNIKKTKWMLVGSPHLLKKCRKLVLSISSIILEQVASFKYLGIYIDEHLSWKVHIKYMTGKISSRLGLLRRVRQFLTTEVTLLLYNALVQPLFDYCDIVWSSATKTELGRLQILHNRAARIILCTKTRDHHVSNLLSRLKWSTLEKRRHQHICNMVFRCINGQVPTYLTQLFNKNVQIHNYNTRHSEYLHVPPARTSKILRSFKHRAVALYNDLPNNVKTAITLSNFKYKSAKYFNQF